MNADQLEALIAELEADRESYKSLARTESAGSQSRHRMEGKASGVALAIKKLREASGL